MMTCVPVECTCTLWLLTVGHSLFWDLLYHHQYSWFSCVLAVAILSNNTATLSVSLYNYMDVYICPRDHL